MPRFPLALLPVVTVTEGRAPLPPSAYGVSAGAGSLGQAVAGWVAQGAGWIHIDDQDAARGGSDHLHQVVRTRAHLQYSGGIADDGRLRAALASAADRVVIESADLDWTERAVSGRDERVAVGLDIRQPDVLDVVGRLQHAGCSRFVVTDRPEKHHGRHEDRQLLADLCRRTVRPVMVRGGISHLSDLHALHEIVPDGLDGILLDEALYDGAFTYSEAMTASADHVDLFVWGPAE